MSIAIATKSTLITLSETESQLKSLVNLIKAELDTGAIDLARNFIALRSVVDRLDEIVDPVSKLYEHMKIQSLPEVFDRHGVPSVSLDEGFRVTVSHTVRASIRKDQKDEAYKWLKDNGLGDIVTETVNSSTLSAVARTMAEDNKELDERLFNVAVIPNTSIISTK